jgi:hypothetical protein
VPEKAKARGYEGTENDNKKGTLARALVIGTGLNAFNLKGPKSVCTVCTLLFAELFFVCEGHL